MNQFNMKIFKKSELHNLCCNSCFGYLSIGPIKLCEDGSSNCGRCAGATKGQLNSPVNHILKSTFFPCIYDVNGCKAKLKWGEDCANHEKKCVYKDGQMDAMPIDEYNFDQIICSYCWRYLNLPPLQVNAAGLLKCGRCYNDGEINSIRNLSLEAVMENFEFLCSFKQKGCNAVLKWHDVETHEDFCPHQVFYCNTFTKGHCDWKGSIHEIARHFAKIHTQTELKVTQILYNRNCHQESRSLVSQGGKLFLVITKNKKFNGTFSVCVRCISELKNDCEFMYNLYSCKGGAKRLVTALNNASNTCIIPIENLYGGTAHIEIVFDQTGYDERLAKNYFQHIIIICILEEYTSDPKNNLNEDNICGRQNKKRKHSVSSISSDDTVTIDPLSIVKTELSQQLSPVHNQVDITHTKVVFPDNKLSADIKKEDGIKMNMKMDIRKENEQVIVIDDEDPPLIKSTKAELIKYSTILNDQSDNGPQNGNRTELSSAILNVGTSTSKASSAKSLIKKHKNAAKYKCAMCTSEHIRYKLLKHIKNKHKEILYDDRIINVHNRGEAKTYYILYRKKLFCCVCDDFHGIVGGNFRFEVTLIGPEREANKYKVQVQIICDEGKLSYANVCQEYNTKDATRHILVSNSTLNKACKSKRIIFSLQILAV